MTNVRVSNLNLESVGITDWQKLDYNLSYDELFKRETDPSLEGVAII